MLEFLYSGDYSVSPRSRSKLEDSEDSSLECKLKLHNTDYGWEPYYEKQMNTTARL